MLKLLKYILLMTFFLVAPAAAKAQYVIDKVCKDAVRTYRVDQGNGEPVISYNWILTDASGTTLSIPAGSPSGAGSEIKITWSFDPGIYTLSVEKLTQFNCQVNELGTIEVTPVPIVDAGADQTVCVETGTLVSLDAAKVTDVTAAGVEWTTNGDGTFSDSKAVNPIYTPGSGDLLAEKVTLKLTAKSLSDDDGCVQEDEIEIKLIPKPLLVIANPEAVCEPGAVDLTTASITEGSTIPLGLTPSYWMDSAATIALANPGNVTVSGIYYIKIGENSDCQDIKPVKVTIDKQPKLVITNPPAVCEPATVDISASYITAGSDPGLTLTYWNDVSATSPLTNKTAIASGGTYYIKADNGTKCPSIMPVSVVINQKATPQFSLTNLLCQNSTPPNLPTTSTNGITGTWNPSVISTSSIGTIPYVFTPDLVECNKPTTIDITITDEIKPVFAAIGPFCMGETPTSLPLTSTNNITGTWSPDIISTATSGTTVYTFTPDPGQCANPYPITILVTEPVTPTFAAIGPICQNSANPLLGTSIEGISGSWSPVFSSANVGPTTYTFTPGGGVCATTATMNITVVPSVTVTFDPIGPFCAGDPAPTLPSASKEGISGTWSPAVVDMTQTRSYAFTPDAGCANPYSMTIVINRLDLNVSATPISSTNPLGSINLAVSGGSGSYSFMWTGPNGFTSTSQNLTGLAVGNYNVTVTDNGSGCPPVSTSATVDRLDELSIRLEATDITCPGGSDGTATAYISNGTPPYSIQWKNSPAPEPINSTIVPIGNLSKDDYFYATVIDATGKSVNSPFVQIKEPSLNYTIDSAIPANPACFGENGSIQLTFGSGRIVPNDNYTVFYDGGQFDAIEISGNRATILAPSGTYNNIYVEVRGCPTNAVSAVVGPAPPPLTLPTVEIVQPDCDIPTGTIKVLTPIPSAGITYTLKGTNPVVLPQTNTTGLFTGLAAGNYDLFYTNAMGCASVPVVSSTINAQPVTPANPRVIVSKEPRCIDSSGEITVLSPLGSNYMYSIDNGTYQASVIFENQIPGNHFIRVKNIIGNCESGLTPITVRDIPPVPHIINLTAEDCLCYGDLGKLNFEFVNVVDGTYVIVYVGGQFNNVKVVNGKASILAPADTYNVLAIEANGCTSPESWTKEIHQPYQISVSATITEIDLKSKQKGEINLTVTGGTGPYQTIWQPNPLNGFAGATTEDIKNLDAGVYVVSVTDANNCQKTYSETIPKANMPPIATNDEFTASCGVITGNLVYDDNGNGSDSDPDGDMIIIDTTPIGTPSHGTLTINPDKSGSFEYVADPGFKGDDSFRYQIFDIKKNPSIPATVTIHIVPDTDGDGIVDEFDPDADGDGILNVDEVLAGQDWKTTDNDGDGYPNYLDIDSDNDGIVDNIEAQSTPGYIKPSGIDKNQNGIDDAYDPAQGGISIVPVDTDGDGIPDFLDVDSDGDGVPDYIEGHDLNADGKPDYVSIGKDSDGDGLDDGFDTFVNVCTPSDNVLASNAAMQDFDGDGMKDWRDENDDDDEYLTRFEDMNGDGDFSNDTFGHPGHPEYLWKGRDCDLFIPNAFSPNGDNIHDYFQIYCTDDYPNAKLYIFDQLGNKLYEKEHYGNLQFWGSYDRAWWDGRTANRAAATTNGGMVAPGTYYYVLQLGNGDVRKSFVFVSY